MSAENFPDPKFTTKIYVITLRRDDYALLEQMLAAAREKLPSMKCVDDVCAALITEACRRLRDAGEPLALPGRNPS